MTVLDTPIRAPEKDTRVHPLVYAWVWRDDMMIRPITGTDVHEYFLTVQHSLDPVAPGFEPVGEPVALGEFQVAVPNHMELNRYDGVMLYTLNQRFGDLKISEIYWIPEQDGIWHSDQPGSVEIAPSKPAAESDN